MSVFVASLSTMAKLWNQPRCPTNEENAMEYYSAIKKNEIMSFVGNSMELDVE
jgi:ribosomal protein L30E